ncbi:MAG TPA: rubrerythrin family protein [Cyanobacteria bacterium UBA11369]|nr:rubrerythrin family protein [Cyanobacteria bacterium UBA11371]HBE33791.1 rubrerythrin family protein [Cyanobacteria bacterium UBA11368]HBE53684.1 rubrerythrin family protein [Cyanobacteria bacterium UBA11369]
MNLLTYSLHLLGSGANAYILARQLRDPLTRPNILAGFQLAESGSVPFLETLRDRAANEGDTWLADKLTRHAADEKRHGLIFAHGLKRLNKRVIDFKQVSETTTEGKPSERDRSPFFAAYFDGYSPESLKPQNIDWIVFLASTYILELDASKDFARMAKVLPEDDPNSKHLKQGILSIANDETRHAAYLYEALQRRLSDNAAAAVVEEWRQRKVNALIAMASNLFQKGGKIPSIVQEGAPTDLPDVDVAQSQLVVA